MYTYLLALWFFFYIFSKSPRVERWKNSSWKTFAANRPTEKIGMSDYIVTDYVLTSLRLPAKYLRWTRPCVIVDKIICRSNGQTQRNISFYPVTRTASRFETDWRRQTDARRIWLIRRGIEIQTICVVAEI